MVRFVFVQLFVLTVWNRSVLHKTNLWNVENATFPICSNCRSTNCMEHSHCWEANSSSASQELSVHFTAILIIALTLEVMTAEDYKYQTNNSCRHHILQTMSSVIFFIYCCPAVVLYDVLKWKVGLSCTNNLLLVLLL